MSTPPTIDKQSVIDRLQGRYLAFYEGYGLAFNRDHRAICPIHKGDGRNFSVNPETGEWYCHSVCKDGGDVFKFVMRLQGVDFPEALSHVADWAGVTPTFVDHSAQNGAHGSSHQATATKATATYEYHDERGELLFEVLRSVGSDGRKTFRQRRPDGNGGWAYNLDGVRRVIYRLPQVLAAIAAGTPVYIVEGEKDVERLESLGMVATTNPMGADKWLDEYGEFFANGKIIIFPDNDKVGREHARKVASSIFKRTRTVRIVELPDVPEKGDISDWLALGNTKQELIPCVKAASNWTPSADLSSSPTEVGTFIGQYLRDYDAGDPAEARQTLAQAVYKASADDTVSAEKSIMSLSDFYNVASEPPPAVAEGLLAQNELILLAGKPKACKSFLAVDILDCICRGRSILGQYPVKEPGPVIYLGMEDNPFEIKRRLSKRGMTDHTLPFYLLHGGRIDLGSADGITELEKLITAANIPSPPVALVVDTARMAIEMENWNDNSEVHSRMKPLLDFARRTCLVIVVAHNRKGAGTGGDVIGGGNALISIADGWMIMGEKKTLEGGHIEVPLEVVVRMGPPRTLTIQMDTNTLHFRSLTPDEEVDRSVVDSANREVEACRKIAVTIEKLRTEYPHQPGWTPATIIKHGVANGTFHKYIKIMLHQGEVQIVGQYAAKTGGGGKTSPLYRLTYSGGAKYIVEMAEESGLFMQQKDEPTGF